MQTDWDLLTGAHFVASRELKEQDVEQEPRGIQLEQDRPSQRPHWAGGCWEVVDQGVLGAQGRRENGQALASKSEVLGSTTHLL